MMFRTLAVLGLTASLLAGGIGQANAINLFVALGTPDAAVITEAVMTERAKNAANIEPAAGNAIKDKFRTTDIKD